MVYRDENASIPVDITNAAMRLPASVQYSIVSIDGVVPKYIADNATTGFLQWDLESGSELELDLGIDWALVDPQLEVELPASDSPYKCYVVLCHMALHRVGSVALSHLTLCIAAA